jgi:type I restriction enzyme S subunit
MDKSKWTYKKLGEIATNMYRGSGIKRDQVTKEGVPCVRYGEIYTTYNYAFEECVSHTNEKYITSPKYFEHGDLLFAITGESVEDIGKTIAYLGHEKCMLGGDIVCMKHEQSPKYLAYALSSPEAIRQKGIGKTKLKVVHTNIPSLSEISIPLPPLSEQQSIVDYLDSAFAKIDAMKANSEKALNEAKALFQASLKEMLEPKEGWEEKTLKEISLIHGNYGLSVPSTEFNGVRYLRITDITEWGELNDEKVSAKIVDNKEQELLEEGDILFARTGATVGKTLMYRNEFGDCLFAGYLIRYRLKKDILNPKFMFYITHSDDYFKWVLDNQKAAAQPNISAKLYNDYKVSYPPLSEQQTIVTTLDSLKSKVDRLQENYDKMSKECDILKQAILRQVFE